MVRKSDGGVGYDSTDLAAIRYRLAAPASSASAYSQGASNGQEVASGGPGGLGCDWLVYVVDSGQALHFDLVFKGAQMAGWYKPLPAGSDYEETAAAASSAGAVAGAGEAGSLIPLHPGAKAARVEHTGFGVIQGEDRKKFKTRSGDTVRLVDVLDEAKERMKTNLMERIAAGSAGFSLATFGGSQEALDAEIEKTASILGFGGVKYFDLRQHRTSDYVFSYDRMLSPDGDTAVYLEYAHARLCSILRKAKEQYGATENIDKVLSGGMEVETIFSHPTEAALVTELLRFTDVIKRTTAQLTPHLLCEFVYSVANRTAEFHRDCNVLGATTPANVRASRLRMVLAAQKTIAEVMRLLGITPLDRI
jgi:arginyl-tRNA synthetase